MKRSIPTILGDCPLNSDESSLLSIQTQFRELKVHTKKINILQAQCQDGKFPQDDFLVNLAQGCCLLCANFCFRNVKNAYLLYPQIEFLMTYLGDNIGLRVKAHEVVLNMFNDNRLLCTQTSQLIENRIVGLIVSLG